MASLARRRRCSAHQTRMWVVGHCCNPANLSCRLQQCDGPPGRSAGPRSARCWDEWATRLRIWILEEHVRWQLRGGGRSRARRCGCGQAGGEKLTLRPTSPALERMEQAPFRAGEAGANASRLHAHGMHTVAPDASWGHGHGQGHGQGQVRGRERVCSRAGARSEGRPAGQSNFIHHDTSTTLGRCVTYMMIAQHAPHARPALLSGLLASSFPWRSVAPRFRLQ